MTVNKQKEQMDTSQQNGDEPPEEWSDDEGTTVDGIYIPPPVKHTIGWDKNSRLIITKITNTFFKSYAGNVILGPFKKCFNAIIGPNGSGKSNVIDAILFVFGHRATRLRCKKVSVLLHNSEQYRNVQSCNVSVHFCQIKETEDDGYEIIPGSELVVSRTGNRDNSSYYELNGRRVQFKEVARVLKVHGVDLNHNRFLILQGEVESIAMMKCKGDANGEVGMLEYLEEIIGTHRYKESLDKLNVRVEQLTEHKTEKNNRLLIVQKKLDALQEPMVEAVSFLKTENETVNCKNYLYQFNIYNLEKEVNEVEAKKAEIMQKHTEIMEQLQETKNSKKAKDAEYEEKIRIHEKLSNKKTKFEDTFNKAEKKDVELGAEMNQVNKTRKKNKENLEVEKKKFSVLEHAPEKNLKMIAEIEVKEKELTKKREKIEQQRLELINTFQVQTQPLQDERDKLQVKLGELKENVNRTKQELAMSESELKIYNSSEQNERTKLEKIEATYRESEEQVQEKTEQLNQLNHELPLKEKSFQKLTNELNAVRTELRKLEPSVTNKRISFEQTRSNLQASKSRGKILDALMKQKQIGKCSGLYGRLGDLGAIDAKFDVAISTACGRLDNIVVDTADTAQWCIRFLKEYDIGRATFIPLENQEHLRNTANSRINTPENVHRLYDLVKVNDEMVKTAFYFALGDTLVANDLDQASRVAYGAKRYRVVTLKGEIIEISGTMSGGGRASSGKMGQSVVGDKDPREIERLETELESLEGRLQQLRGSEINLETQINTLRPELKQMSQDKHKLGELLNHLNVQLPWLQNRLKQQQELCNKVKGDPKQIRELNKIIEKKREEFNKASAVTEELQRGIDNLSNEIANKTTDKIKVIDKELREVVKQIDRNNSEVAKLNIANKNNERDKQRCNEKMENLKRSIEENEAKILQMVNERKEIEEDSTKILTCIEEITEQIEEQRQELEELKKEINRLVSKENKIKSEKVDVDEAVKNVTKQFNEQNGLIHNYHAKLASLKLHEIPGEAQAELKKHTEEEFNATMAKRMENELESTERILKTTKPNLTVLDEYRKCQQDYNDRSAELQEITDKRNTVRDVLERVLNQRKQEFVTGYNIIKSKLKEIYQMITLGGDADFEIVDSFDPFSEGIQFTVRPPKKTWKKISNLSGGEKTLSSLALVFALHHYKPSPLYVMDEIDAALDFKNVSIIGNYIKERTKNAQFIIISLRSQMFELADNFIGIYKTFNQTKTITLDPIMFSNNHGQEIGIVETVQAPQNRLVAIVENESQEDMEIDTLDQNICTGAINELQSQPSSQQSQDDSAAQEEPRKSSTSDDSNTPNVSLISYPRSIVEDSLESD